MFQSIIALIQTFPTLVAIVQRFVHEWELYQISKLEEKYANKANQVKAIVTTLSKENTTDEERKYLVRILHDLRSGLPK